MVVPTSSQPQIISAVLKGVPIEKWCTKIAQPVMMKYAIPFHRPMLEGRKLDPANTCESIVYCKNANAINDGKSHGSSPIQANTAVIEMTNVASAPWSSKVPNRVSCPDRRAMIPSRKSLTTTTKKRAIESIARSLTIDQPTAGMSANRTQLTRFGKVATAIKLAQRSVMTRSVLRCNAPGEILIGCH